ncbi:MAG: GNAT family N-acetyltransferase [Alphaproteobacteria bacterium]|nr:GNAT family N-acetyltransferase [Alphaproteobacteria bacterium]
MAITIVQAAPEKMERHIGDLADIHIDCVEGGALVSFMLPISREKVLEYWRDISAGVRKGNTIPFLAVDGAEVIGGVLLSLAELANQPHVAQVRKLLVPRKHRRKGVARQLIQALEAEAINLNRLLLYLDTVKGSPAESLYRELGYEIGGVIPNFALLPDGTRCESVIFYKQL